MELGHVEMAMADDLHDVPSRTPAASISVTDVVAQVMPVTVAESGRDERALEVLAGLIAVVPGDFAERSAVAASDAVIGVAPGA